MHGDGEDGYTSSDEAIMDAFGEMPEKPAKKPVASFADIPGLSESELPEDDAEEEKSDGRERNYDEFTSYDQKRTFLDAYKRKYQTTKVSLALSAVFAALVFLYECFSLSPDKFPYFCSPVNNPAVFILIDR